ncbi:2OG-Fe dioxygenase family protein [Streptomyces rectiverticillatus]|uniref:2OG-Fe dioxygenase family protein n=1 Tax=Streptomyces rectiverticillatus TaxID=173860 RepID=UPI0015C337D0|nr:2OG-Fe dioxygenase family protein [Streptomyces rectiverticillatus]
MDRIGTVVDMADAVVERGDLQARGFERYRPLDVAPGSADGPWRADLERLAGAFEDLPADPYAPQENRFRRFGHAVCLPWNGVLSWIPDVPDPDYGWVAEFRQTRHPHYDRGRRFPGLPEDVRANPLLQHLMRWAAGRTQWREEYRINPLYYTVHLVKFAARAEGDVAVASPNCLHQDGDSSFVFAHLISRTNLVGGETCIARAQCAGRQPGDLSPGDLHASFTLDEPLDSYAVHDPEVSHYVASMRRGPASGPGERCIVLMGVMPYTLQLPSAEAHTV